MEIYKIISIALLMAMLCYYLKTVNSEFFLPALICSGIIILTNTVNYLGESVSFFKVLLEKANVDNSLISLLLKVIIISYLVEFSAGMIEDLGLKSISDKLIFAGKILVFCISLPIFEYMFEIVINFLE